MRARRLLLPFTHGLDMHAIEQALLFAQGRGAILVALALVHVPHGRRPQGARLEHVQQSKDFLEAVKYKAIRYGMPVERLEVFTGDIVQSIHIVAGEQGCEGILLFARGGESLLLQTQEMKGLLEQALHKLYIVRLPQSERRHLLRRIGQWLSDRRSRKQKQSARLLPMQSYVMDAEIAPAQVEEIGHKN